MKKITVIKICPTCKKEFIIPYPSLEKRKFCSMACRKVIPWNKGLKGIHLSPQSEFKKGQTAPNKGKHWKQSKEARKRRIGTQAGSKHYNWKGGITSENCKIRTSTAYREWRMSVFKRDSWTCVKCGYRSSSRRNEKCDIIADHIKPFHLYPELRLDIDNGRTLCIKCDYKFGYNYHRDKNKIEYKCEVTK